MSESACVEIVTIGTELLLGDLVDTNSAFIARMLADRGIDVFAKHSVGDNRDRLSSMLTGALENASGVVTTGGLGPTVDDLTKEAVASATGAELVLHEPSLRVIEERCARMGRAVGENDRRQAILPRGCVVLDNPHGTAPGFIAVRADGRFVACMPGVPREMRPMLNERLLPWLVERLNARGAIVTRTLHTVGISEAELDRRVEDLFRSLDNPKIAMLAHAGRVDVKIMAKVAEPAAAEALLVPLEARLRERIGADVVYGVDEERLEEVIVRDLVARGLTLATAESVSGGGIADAIVSVPGASRCFRGGVIAYDNAIKMRVLGVEEETLRRHGAVSEETAVAMARGACRVLDASVAVAVTGIAGPSGGSEEKPVGLVWLALAWAGDRAPRTLRVQLPGTREDVRRRTVLAALRLIWQEAGHAG